MIRIQGRYQGCSTNKYSLKAYMPVTNDDGLFLMLCTLLINSKILKQGLEPKAKRFDFKFVIKPDHFSTL